MPSDLSVHVHDDFSRDPDQIQALKEICHNGDSQGWGFDDFIAVGSRPDRRLLFATDGKQGRWLGLLLAQIGPYESELLYLFVRGEARRRGIGIALVERLITLLTRSRQTEALTLEVRVTNKAAISLYEQLGMTRVGKRLRYYSDGESAWVYRRDLSIEGDVIADETLSHPIQRSSQTIRSEN